MIKKILFGIAFLSLIKNVQAEPTFYIGKDKKVTFFQMVQIWNIYGLEYDIPGETDLKDNRYDIFIRRGRFGLKGKIRKDLAYKVAFAYDNFGKDDLNSNDGAKGSIKKIGSTYSKIQIWDAFFTWEKNPEWLNITIGFFRPQIGRENITSGFSVFTFEKVLPNSYVRRHVIGKPDTKTASGFASGNGRAFNITFGGLHKEKDWSLSYNFGLVDNQNYTNDRYWSLQTTARISISIGDPEMDEYKIGYKQTYFGRRNGTTISLNYSHQGKGIDRTKSNKIFNKNDMYGVDILANYGSIDFVAEYDMLKRDWNDGTNYLDKVWAIKTGYLIFTKKGFIQPVIAYSVFQPDKNGNSIYGNKKNSWYDIGINWYINKRKFKISTHYTYGKIENYQNKDTTPIVIGNVKVGYVGIGFQFIY